MTTLQKPLGKRLAVVQLLLVIWLAAIGGKLVWLQVKQHDWLLARAGRQQQTSIELSPTRGVIYDRNGNELARSVEAKSLYAAPAEIKDPDRAADELSVLLDVDRDALYKRLTSAQVLVAVKRRLADREVAEVEKLGWQGLTFVNEMKRHYITGQSAAHVLGFVDTDERAGGGIELAYDKLVRGRGGNLSLDVDAFNKSYNHSVEESVPGANVTLTIDLVIQHHVEKALAQAVRASRARGGTVVIVRPATGEILALASYPTFDPNKVGDSTDIQRQNRAVETAFEPGSIFKMITYSAAIEEKLIRANTRIDCGSGQIRIADRVIHDHPYGVLTAAQALAKSSNVAAIKVGMMLGNERFARYIEQFGFGRRTGIELPAESRGLFRPASEWTPVTIGSIPMGHEIAVTAVQTAAAYACIANGGEWLKPHMVSKVTTAYGDVIEEHHPEKRQVVSQTTAATLKAMLEGVVMQGTGKAAKLGGYRAAGKTGTAQKVDEKSGRYSNTRHVASFAGFAPVENPEIACVVSIDEPVGAHHGGTVAAPVFARVVADALRVLGVAPEDDPHSMLADNVHTYDLPDMVTDAVPKASESDEDLRPSIDIAAEPASDDPASNRFGSIVVPDLVGLGIREAVAMCASRGLKMKASGDGVVAMQNPSPGSLVARDATCRVKLSRDYSRKEPPDAAAASSPSR